MLNRIRTNSATRAAGHSGKATRRQIRLTAPLTAIVAVWMSGAACTGEGSFLSSFDAEATGQNAPSADSAARSADDDFDTNTKSKPAKPEDSSVTTAPKPKPSDAADSGAAAVPRPAVSPVHKRADIDAAAKRVRALIDGTLSGAVDGRSLFRVDIRDVVVVDADTAPLWKQLIKARSATVVAALKARCGASALDTDAPCDPLLSAYTAFFALEIEERERILAAQREKCAICSCDAKPDSGEVARTGDTQLRDSLAAFLQGKGGSGAVPDAAFVVDLLGDDASSTSTKSDTDAPADRQCEPTLRTLQLRYFSLPPKKRERLAALADENMPVAAQAGPTAGGIGKLSASTRHGREGLKRQMNQLRSALADARASAKTDPTPQGRLTAEEKARLLAVAIQIVERRLALLDGGIKVEKVKNEYWEWYEKISEISKRSVLDETRTPDADAAFEKLTETLDRIQTRLGEVLDRLQSPDPPNPAASPEGRHSEDFASVGALRTEVSEAYRKLVQDERAFSRMLAVEAKRLLAALNQQRQQLIEYINPQLRASVVGFGPPGVRQAGLEWRMMRRFISYKREFLARRTQATLELLRESPLTALLLLLKLAILIFIFRLWRKNAPSMFDNLERGESKIVAAVARYYRQIRNPLEWMVVTIGVLRIINLENRLETLEYLEILIFWTALAWSGILLINAFASRRDLEDDIRRDLVRVRFRTIRFLGVVFIAVRLVLAVVASAVGKGTIYHWISAWTPLAYLPAFGAIVWWWRPVTDWTIREREDLDGVLQWVRNHRIGWLGVFASVVGAVYLLFEEAIRLIVYLLSENSVVKSVLAYRFRSEISKKGESGADATDGLPELTETQMRAFYPEGDAAFRVDEVGQAAREALLEGFENGTVSLVALVGERYSGKTFFLARLAEAVSGEVVSIDCGALDTADLVNSLGEQFRLSPGATADELAARMGRASLICFDRAHALFLPVIGGMTGLQRLLSFVISGDVRTTPVVFAFDFESWRYVSQALDNAELFDSTVHVEKFSEPQIAALVDYYCEHSDVRIDFKMLETARTFQDARSLVTKRAKRGFVSVLFDYCRGNPGLARYWMDHSLVFDPKRSRYLVRLFTPPQPTVLSTLSVEHKFILSTLLRTGAIGAESAAKCMGTTVDQAKKTLDQLTARALLVETPAGFAVNIHWYKAILILLRREHLEAG